MLGVHIRVVPCPARSDFRFAASPLVKLERNAEARSPSPNRLLRNGSDMSSRPTLKVGQPLQSARPYIGRATTPSPTNSPKMVRAAMSRSKNDDGVSESTKVMRYLQQQRQEQQAATEQRGTLARSPSKLRHDQLDPARSGLKSTGLLNEMHTVFTLGVWSGLRLLSVHTHPSPPLLSHPPS